MNQFKQPKSCEQWLNILSISNFQFTAKLALKRVRPPAWVAQGLFSGRQAPAGRGSAALGCEQSLYQRQRGVKGMWGGGGGSAGPACDQG